MKHFFFLVLIIACTSLYAKAFTHDISYFAGGLKKKLELFKQKYNKTYGDLELYREKFFYDNLYYVSLHNIQNLEEKNTSFYLGLNKYADLDIYEVNFRLTGYRTYSKRFIGSLHLPIKKKILVKSLDWREQGYVTNVKDQGLCASDWAFAAIGSLEGQLFKKNKQLVSLSEQNLMDCSYKFGNFGCKGGLITNSFEYFKSNEVIDDTLYPYEGKNDICRYSNETINGTVIGYKYIEEGDEDALLEAITTIGPISAAIDGRHLSFQLYSTGIYEEENCSNDYVDHGVLIVGYGIDEETGKKYWLVKNSFGESWGENGYMRIVRGQNMCGIANRASYPLL